MKADNEINQWKQARRTEVPDQAEEFTERVLRQLEPARPSPPLLWLCRFALVALAVALIAGRFLATASAFFASTPTQ